MVHVSEIMDVSLLDQMIKEGFVRVQTHPTLPLFIYNYTEQAQFEKRWNEATLGCRGLILDADRNIVARPWKKFFNYGEGRLRIDDEMPVEVTDKMDGSLGILYWDGTKHAIATRGSFASEQAIHATKVFDEKYADLMYEAPWHVYTFLFEIIYPENRIVLNYGDMDDLVLLGAVHIERGYYLGPNEAAGILSWNGPVTRVFPYRNIAEAFSADPRPNAEGFVVRSGTEIVKIKQVDYVELHRIVTNLSPLTVWRRLSAGETVEQLADAIPDEWHEWLRREAHILNLMFEGVEFRVMSEWTRVRSLLGDDFTRKDFAMIASKSPEKAYLFAMLDSKPIDQMIWSEVRPNGQSSV